jgi:hypothetical protein
MTTARRSDGPGPGDEIVDERARHAAQSVRAALDAGRFELDVRRVVLHRRRSRAMTAAATAGAAALLTVAVVVVDDEPSTDVVTVTDPSAPPTSPATTTPSTTPSTTAPPTQTTGSTTAPSTQTTGSTSVTIAGEPGEIGPELAPDVVLDLPAEGLVIEDLEDGLVLVGLDGTVYGHIGGYALEARCCMAPLLDVDAPYDPDSPLGTDPHDVTIGGPFLTPAAPSRPLYGSRRLLLELDDDGPHQTLIVDGAARPFPLPSQLSADGTIVTGQVDGAPSRVYDAFTDADTTVPEGCAVGDRVGTSLVLVCGLPDVDGTDARPEIRLQHADGTLTVVAGPPADQGGGSWRGVSVSPDGTTLLAQWSGECEVPHAFFVSLQGGPIIDVSGTTDVEQRPETKALGWAADGRAIVHFGAGACGLGLEPGVYLVAPDGARQLVYATDSYDAARWQAEPLRVAEIERRMALSDPTR